MNKRVSILLEQLKKRDYRAERRSISLNISDFVKEKSEMQKDAAKLLFMLAHETPCLYKGDRIGFNRTVTDTPYYIDEKGKMSNECAPGNITPDYKRVLEIGLDGILRELDNCIKEKSDNKTAVIMKETVLGAIEFAERYKNLAMLEGNNELYNALCNVPRKGASSYYEACVFLKFIIFTLRCNRNTHITLGRFDQYMYPYYQEDIKRGVTKEEILSLTEEFFISINFDTDLYHGVQQGDNGQSLVLGGVDENWKDMYNELSDIIMEASLELNIIDPKINIRVSKNTPFERYVLGSKLTAKGLGFPQYSNDDVVIDGLVNLGYDLKDAADYTVAACWEFIIPGRGMDVPNIITMNFPAVVRQSMADNLEKCESYEELWKCVADDIKSECERLIAKANKYELAMSPYLSVFVEGCAKSGRDISDFAAKYNNFGCHGAGISNAADALAAVKLLVFEKGEVGKAELLEAMEADFEGYEQLRYKLLKCPKMGNNDDYADGIASMLMKVFAENMNNKPNSRGGIFRAGTGSAMEYILSAINVGATADGRKAGAPYASSFSPSLCAHTDGILSVIKSFTKFDMKNISNGGPVTVELHNSIFKNSDGIEKTAMLVREFIRLGGHQIQLNSINRDILLDAQKHPENHQDLIVRVWGWSGYFNELAPEYQEHVIKRVEYVV